MGGEVRDGSSPTGHRVPPPTPSPSLIGRGTFRASTVRLAGLAGVLLGWRPDEFWLATPEELATILSAYGGEREGLAGTELVRLQEMFPDG